MKAFDGPPACDNLLVHKFDERIQKLQNTVCKITVYWSTIFPLSYSTLMIEPDSCCKCYQLWWQYCVGKKVSYQFCYVNVAHVYTEENCNDHWNYRPLVHISGILLTESKQICTVSRYVYWFLRFCSTSFSCCTVLNEVRRFFQLHLNAALYWHYGIV